MCSSCRLPQLPCVDQATGWTHCQFAIGMGQGNGWGVARLGHIALGLAVQAEVKAEATSSLPNPPLCLPKQCLM